MRIDIVSNRDEPSDLHPYEVLHNIYLFIYEYYVHIISITFLYTYFSISA